jgi:hypothetical protein
LISVAGISPSEALLAAGAATVLAGPPPDASGGLFADGDAADAHPARNAATKTLRNRMPLRSRAPPHNLSPHALSLTPGL